MTSPLQLLANTYRAFFSGFTSLKSIQKQLIQPILSGHDVVLQASTGAGKTEAVLAPATEKLIVHRDPFTIVYIVPTRALALDMHRRIKPIYKRLSLKSGIRTGDGKHLLDSKPDLLIMTPESLDVMLGSSDPSNKYFLKHVHIVIVDEVHVFLHDNRGIQLSYLHRRLAMQCVARLQTVALSATVDEPEDVIRIFNLQKNAFCLKHSTARKLQPSWVHIADEERELPLFFDDLYRCSGCRKLLVFANSRKKCEQLNGLLRGEGVFSDQVFLHYSNLSTKERKFIESAFREKKAAVCIATSTLELGIDIGDVDGVVLIGPPPSTMAFLQRIGRGNRREAHINFWGVCYGHNPGDQLIRFLALFELAKANQVEKCLSAENYSVLFQQVLSCLYAKKALSVESLTLLFKEKAEVIPSLFQQMAARDWLKPAKQPGLYEGGWRFFVALRNRQIWSNFPPTEEEYDVILEEEKIAVLPLSSVRQLEMGDIVRLAGKTLQVLQIEEKKAALEVWVEETKDFLTKELLWVGLGAPIAFEVAQKMGEILLDTAHPEGLLKRTRQLLEEEREKRRRAIKQPNGMLVYQQDNGIYRYETFLGSIGNYILYRVIETQLASKIEGLCLNFDELGIECNEWIPFKSVKIPYSIDQLQEWIASHISLVKGGFAWNSWLHELPVEYQNKEMGARFIDPRVLERFQRYHLESTLQAPPNYLEGEKTGKRKIQVEGEAWSLGHEKRAWGKLSFPELPVEPSGGPSSLTATQLQAYVTQKLCPRWARLQHLGYHIEAHPRFNEGELELKVRRQQGNAFKKQVFEQLERAGRFHFETAEWTLQAAIKRVLADKKSLFLAQARLKSEGAILGSPDLIYIQHQESHICLEVWDITCSESVSYAQKWRVAYYVYLLNLLLENEAFELPVKVSSLGGLVNPSSDQKKLFEKSPFLLTPYTTWMPRLIWQWKVDARSHSALESYSIESSCATCRYFSYCYQEALFKDEPKKPAQEIISQNIDSNDFPKNTKQWFFVHWDKEGVRWQCWEKELVVGDVSRRQSDFPDMQTFRKKVVVELQEAWVRSVNQKKNPHFLVYESSDWYPLQKAFELVKLEAMNFTHVCWTSIQNVLKTHFTWPIEGRLTSLQVAACLGFAPHRAPSLTLYHKEPFLESSLDLYRKIWNWCLSKVKSQRVVSFEVDKGFAVPLIQRYLAMHQREVECRLFDILEFQKKALSERVKLFRSIGPLKFMGGASEKKGYQFSFDAQSAISKFRVGDFLKLSPVGSDQIQDGFSVVLDTYSSEEGVLSVRPLSPRVSFNKNQLYALDEDATDWNSPKITRILELLKDRNFNPEVIQMVLGHTKSRISNSMDWVEQWYSSVASIAKLNSLQESALRLPFREKLGLIEGPPGTGKTHLLVWTLIALVAHAKSCKRPMKILVTAQTHHAIDQILKKVAKTLSEACLDPVSLYKYGRYDENQFFPGGIRELQSAKMLEINAWLILGATGYGVYQLLENRNFPQIFDWVVFDESSQVLAPYALLALVFGKGQALFYGDTQQLPPVLRGNYEHTSIVPRSILEELISRYGPQNRLRLNETYRMNEEICRFVSEQWYDGELQSTPKVKGQKLALPHYPVFGDTLDIFLDPSKSLTMVLLEHLGAEQTSPEEAAWITQAVKRLIDGYFIAPEQIGIISPHRLQNNTILIALKKALPFALKLPRVDTVERMQGLEFDVVIFSGTASEKETVHSDFLKDYRRFNVAVSRARKKFILVASNTFFQTFPPSEKALLAQVSFEKMALEQSLGGHFKRTV